MDNKDDGKRAEKSIVELKKAFGDVGSAMIAYLNKYIKGGGQWKWNVKNAVDGSLHFSINMLMVNLVNLSRRSQVERVSQIHDDLLQDCPFSFIHLTGLS